MARGNDDIPAWQKKLIETTNHALENKESRFDTRPRFTKEERDEYLAASRQFTTPAPALRPDNPLRAMGDQAGFEADAKLLSQMDADVLETELGKEKTSFSRDELDRF